MSDNIIKTINSYYTAYIDKYSQKHYEQYNNTMKFLDNKDNKKNTSPNKAIDIIEKQTYKNSKPNPTLKLLKMYSNIPKCYKNNPKNNNIIPNNKQDDHMLKTTKKSNLLSKNIAVDDNKKQIYKNDKPYPVFNKKFFDVIETLIKDTKTFLNKKFNSLEK